MRQRRAQYSSIGVPSTYSITRYGRPSAVVPPSSRRAMFGCSSAARICRSCRKRCTSVSPPRTSLIATRCAKSLVFADRRGTPCPCRPARAAARCDTGRSASPRGARPRCASMRSQTELLEERRPARRARRGATRTSSRTLGVGAREQSSRAPAAAPRRPRGRDRGPRPRTLGHRTSCSVAAQPGAGHGPFAADVAGEMPRTAAVSSMVRPA